MKILFILVVLTVVGLAIVLPLVLLQGDDILNTGTDSNPAGISTGALVETMVSKTVVFTSDVLEPLPRLHGQGLEDVPSDTGSESSSEGQRSFATVNSISGAIVGIVLPTKNTDTKGIVLMGISNTDAVITEADVHKFGPGQNLPGLDANVLIQFEANTERKTDRAIVLPAYLDFSFEVNTVSYVVRVAFTDYLTMKKGDKLIRTADDPTFRWLDSKNNKELSATRPAEPYLLEQISKSKRAIAPLHLILQTDIDLAGFEDAGSMSVNATLTVHGGNMLKIRVKPVATMRDVLRRFHFKLRKHLNRSLNGLAAVIVLQFQSTTPTPTPTPSD
jgi:hypothetical protein